MESEKVKEIKKALEHWKNDGVSYFDDKWSFHSVKNSEVLDLINELESENEILHRDFVVKAYDKLRAENKQLRTANKIYLAIKQTSTHENIHPTLLLPGNGARKRS